MVVLGAGLVQIGGAHRAQPGAVLAAEHLRGHLQGERVAHPGREVEHLIMHVGAVQLLAPARPVHLAALHLEARRALLQAAHARARRAPR